MSKRKKIKDRDIFKIAFEVIDLLIKEGLWFDICIYCLNYAFYTDGYFYPRRPYHYFSRKSGEYTADIYVLDNINVHKYLKYHGDILSIAFEGNLRDRFIYSSLSLAMHDILAPYGLYYEIREHWNLSVYPKD